ncbi:HGL057Wp [Eremothecium sinecaudum]|uniref:HGL057Wp n=1 Tax=Eremothecium sinecaudum TaxID=45286 RepID=A0A0X8HVP7_9SACH|nr:HGL057Wp [Eremothecium sinecaudum]AMD22283.1 HGL057Wp [Eremothecium sinecaudum]
MAQENRWKWVLGTAVVTVAVTKAVESLYHLYSLKYGKSDVNDKDIQLAKRIRSTNGYDDELYREQLARNYAFFGEQGMENLKNQYFIVVGAGGVGSWVVAMLVRSGCTKLKIIDFDQVSLSSLNRHSCANTYDVGLSKVDVLKEHMLKIAPWCKIEAVNELWNKESADRLIFGEDGLDKPTFVIDCIDNITTKVDLLEYVYKKKIPVIASMGAATKSDPTRINVGDLSMTEEDPLARSIRRRLKLRGITKGIPVVFSAEKPDPKKAKLLPLPEEEFQKGNVEELSALKDFRVRVLPVLTTMPGVFGLTIATWVMCKIAGYPMEPIVGKNRIKVYDGIYNSLVGQTSRIGIPDQRVPVSVNDIGYILEEVFRGKSPISGYSTRLTLSKWDPSKPVSLQNVVIMTKEEQAAHEERVLNGSETLEQVYSAEVLNLINQRFSEEKYYSQFR